MRSTSSDLPIPTCAEAQSVGFAMPEFLFDMEEDLGGETVRAFLSAWGGQRLSIPTTDSKAITSHPHSRAIRWLREELGFGTMTVPLGPARRAVRMIWAVRNASRDGRSTAEIARKLNLTTRTVVRYRQRLRAHGHDLNPTTDRTPDR